MNLTEKNFLCVTKKELFYTAVMLKLRQLVNVVYNFPADDNKFDQELSEARTSLRKKKLLTESARTGITLDIALCACAAFCAAPESCEVIDTDNYYATVYTAKNMHMLMERCSGSGSDSGADSDSDSDSGEGNDELRAVWFLNRQNLDKYIDSKVSKINLKLNNLNKEGADNGRT